MKKALLFAGLFVSAITVVVAAVEKESVTSVVPAAVSDANLEEFANSLEKALAEVMQEEADEVKAEVKS